MRGVIHEPKAHDKNNNAIICAFQHLQGDAGIAPSGTMLAQKKGAIGTSANLL